ncbi:uncharacterized protein LOC124156014 [Ischnura elegans]|uniref:uncharacterized protein LOC124156014 n=1 Tax=Ischnura elegans TaxID=197161 RepID=UPI001ED8BFD0|nr:uncharacterized protein LOC124156014 [Ischnura elegans]
MIPRVRHVVFGAVHAMECCADGITCTAVRQGAQRAVEISTNGPMKTSRRRAGAGSCRVRRMRRDSGASVGGQVEVSPWETEACPGIEASAAERLTTSERDVSECPRVPTGNWSAADAGAEARGEGSCRSGKTASGADGLFGCVCLRRPRSCECRTSQDEREERCREAASRLSACNFDDMRAAAVLPGSGSGGQCKSSGGSWPRRRARQSPLHNLSEALLIGVWLISLLRLPTLSLGVPLGRGIPSVSMAEDRFNTKPKWINACGAHMDSTDGRQSMDGRHSPPVGSPLLDLGEHLSDDMLIDNIRIVATGAIDYAKMWRRDYVNQTFNVDFVQHHEAWRTNRYSWLPTLDDIPKELGEPVPDDHLKKLTFVDALKSTFTFMQKYACGLEQVTWDLEDNHSPFLQNFRNAELHLRDIICEIEVALIEKGEKVPSDVQRNIMPREFRSVSHETHRNLRDWLIFRDYMNGVEYVIRVLEYLKARMAEEKA